MVAEGGDGDGVVEFEAVEAAFGFDGPLFGGFWVGHGGGWSCM